MRVVFEGNEVCYRLRFQIVVLIDLLCLMFEVCLMVYFLGGCCNLVVVYLNYFNYFFMIFLFFFN